MKRHERLSISEEDERLPRGQDPNAFNAVILCDISHHSEQNRRKSSLWECIFDNMALHFECD